MRYRLPEALGGGECILLNPPSGNGVYARATIGEGEDAFTIDLDRNLLTPVKPPLPEEPPVGAYRVGGVMCMRVSAEPAKCWVYQTKGELFDEDTFAELCDNFGTEVVPLVPDPFAEPVKLPWSSRIGEFPTTVRVELCTDGVSLVLQSGGRRICPDLAPEEARELARALMTAADAAEREQS